MSRFLRRGDRVVEGAALEKRCAREGTAGSNPALSANLQFQHFGKRLPRRVAPRQARYARQSPILQHFATLRVAKKKRLGFGFGSSFAQNAKQNKVLLTNLFSFRFWRNMEAIIFNILTYDKLK